MRLIADMIAYTVEQVPRWNPINVCSYHLQEAGATPVQEIGTFLRTSDSFNVYQGGKGQVADTLTPGSALRIKMATTVNYVASHY